MKRWEFEADLEEKSCPDLNLADSMIESQESSLNQGFKVTLKVTSMEKSSQHKVFVNST